MTDSRRPIARLASRLAYLGVLLTATLSSLRWDADPGAVHRRLVRMLHPDFTPRDAVDAARNVVLFAGWGLVWLATAPKRRTARAVGLAVLTGAVISLTVESAQLFSSSRTASVADLVTNTVGSLVGALLLVAAVRGLESRRSDRSFVGLPAAVFAGAYGAAVLGEALVPLFRQSRLPGVYGGPLHRFVATISQFHWQSVLALPLTDLLLFLPAGFLAVAALVEAGLSYDRASRWTAGAGAALMAAAEAAHGFIAFPIEAGAALLHAAAIAVGALAARRFLPGFTRRYRGRDRPRILAAVYAIALLLWALRPYVPETRWADVVFKLSTRWWIPLRFLGMRVDVFSVVDVVNSFLLFLPLGALLAVWPLRRRGWLAACLPAVYLAATGELMQTFIAGRTLDGTDLLIEAAGAVVGWAVARRAGFRARGVLLGD